MASDSDRLARLRREAQVLAALNHPNIATNHGFGDSGGVHALVLELVKGADAGRIDSMKDQCQSRRRSPSRASCWLDSANGWRVSDHAMLDQMRGKEALTPASRVLLDVCNATQDVLEIDAVVLRKGTASSNTRSRSKSSRLAP